MKGRNRVDADTGKGQVIVGLDVGTTKVCAIAGRLEDGRMNIMALGSSPSRGLRKGIVVNIESTINSIRNAVREAEEKSGIELNAVYVGIAGGHVKSFESYGAVGIRDEEVTSGDIEKALEAAKAVYVPLDREVLHVMPVEYVVDGQGGINNPVGMSGVRLEARVQIVTGSVTAVQNLIKCCERAGLQVIDIVLEPLASALATLTEDEKKEGVVLVDIGGGTTDIAYYKNGILASSSVIAMGGNHITNDLMAGLKLPLIEAERVKKAYGTAIPVSEKEKDDVQIMVAGRDEKTIRRSYLTDLINPRCEEMIEFVSNEIKRSGAYDGASYGMVLTGGASQLEGFERMYEAMLGMPVRIGVPMHTSGSNEMVMDPMYSTGVGLLHYGSDNESVPIASGDIFGSIIDKMKRWVLGFFRG